MRASCGCADPGWLPAREAANARLAKLAHRLKRPSDCVGSGRLGIGRALLVGLGLRPGERGLQRLIGKIQERGRLGWLHAKRRLGGCRCEIGGQAARDYLKDEPRPEKPQSDHSEEPRLIVRVQGCHGLLRIETHTDRSKGIVAAAASWHRLIAALGQAAARARGAAGLASGACARCKMSGRLALECHAPRRDVVSRTFCRCRWQLRHGRSPETPRARASGRKRPAAPWS